MSLGTGTGILLTMAAFLAFGIYSVAKRSNYNTFKTHWDALYPKAFRRFELLEMVKLINSTPNVSLTITDYTAIKVSEEVLPVIIGNYSESNKMKFKTVYTIAGNQDQKEALLHHPEFFKPAFKSGDYHVFWVVNLNKIRSGRI